jgi:glutaredoxin
MEMCFMPQSEKELVMYSRTTPCPFVSLARRVLDREGVPYRELYIDREKENEHRVVTWTGFMSVPTLVIANLGEDLPYEEPSFLAKGATPRGVNRGSMLTEPSEDQLISWLEQHGLLTRATSS